MHVGYVHSDRAKSFMSSELVSHLYGMRIATSRTSAYNPRGNGQCEKYNDTIWSAVLLALKNRNLLVSEWESGFTSSASLYSFPFMYCH